MDEKPPVSLGQEMLGVVVQQELARDKGQDFHQQLAVGSPKKYKTRTSRVKAMPLMGRLEWDHVETAGALRRQIALEKG